jgi:predicted permease
MFLRGRLDREMQEEMELHLTRSTQRLTSRGLSAEEARRTARREFGNVDYLQEQSRDARGARWVESTIADLRFGIRHFGRTPLSTTTMIVLMALGIGVNIALFTVLHSTLTMPPAGMPRDKAVVRIRGLHVLSEGRGLRDRRVSYPEYLQYAAQSKLFSAVSASAGADVLIDLGNAQETLESAAVTYVTDNYFGTHGVSLVLGSGLPATPTTDLATPQLVAVIGHTLWDRHFGKSPDVLGKTLKLNDVTVTIVGVAPPKFVGARVWGSPLKLWLPLSARAPIERSNASAFASYDSTFMTLVARLQPGIKASHAIPTVDVIAKRAGQEATRRQRNAVASADVAPVLYNNVRPQADLENVIGAAAVAGIALLILLVTCTNVSALLVGLGVARRREIAVRLSLGASRRRIVRQLITESVLLALAAGSLGLFVIWVLLQVFGARVPDVQLALNWPALAFTLGFAIATGIVFGVSPALHATRLAVSDVLKDSATAVAAARSWLQSGLVVAQIALTQPLLVGLGTLTLLVAAELRGRPDGTLHDRILSVSFQQYSGNVTSEQRREYIRRLQERFAALPGVVGAVQQANGQFIYTLAVHPTDRVPGVDYKASYSVRAESAPIGYFAMLEIPFLRGRDFIAADLVDDRAAVIDSDVARQLWGPADPIGRRFVQLTGRDSGSTAFEVVGVINEANTLLNNVDDRVRVYIPDTRLSGGFLIRTSGPAEPMIPVIRSVANAEAPTMPLTRARTLAAIDADSRSFAL